MTRFPPTLVHIDAARLPQAQRILEPNRQWRCDAVLAAARVPDLAPALPQPHAPTMTTLYTLAYPRLQPEDGHRIEAFRRTHDPHAALLPAHFTLVFGCDSIATETYLRHVEAVCRQARPLDFVCRYAMPAADGPARAYVYRVPDGSADSRGCTTRCTAGRWRAHCGSTCLTSRTSRSAPPIPPRPSWPATGSTPRHRDPRPRRHRDRRRHGRRRAAGGGVSPRGIARHHGLRERLPARGCRWYTPPRKDRPALERIAAESIEALLSGPRV